MRVFSSPLMLRGLAASGVLVLLVGGGILVANQRGVGKVGSGAGPLGRPARVHSGAAAVGSIAATPLRYRRGAEMVLTSAVMSRADYTKADLPAGIRQEVHDTAQIGTQSSMAPTNAGRASQPQLGQATVGKLESCVSTVAASGPSAVLLVEIARYVGRPATIIVFKPINNAFDVIVVGEACGPANQDIMTRLIVPTK